MARIEAHGVAGAVARTACALGLAALIGGCSGGPTASALPSPTAHATALQPLDVLAKIAIPDPFEIAEGFGSIWVGANLSGNVVRIDPATNAILAKVQVSTFTSGLAVTGDAIWVIDGDTQSVRRIDPKTNTLTKDSIAMGDDGGSLSWFGGHLWQSGRGHATRIDPVTREVTTFQLPGTCSDCSLAIVGGQGYTYSDGTLQRIDLTTHQVVASNATDVAGGLVGVGPDGLWAGSSTAGLALLDPMTLKLRKTFTASPATAGGSTWSLGKDGGDGAIVPGETGAWVRFSGPVLGRVTAAATAVELFGPFPVGRGGGFVLADGSIWLLNIGDAPGATEPSGVWRLAPPKA
jgi:hypothetical protein